MILPAIPRSIPRTAASPGCGRGNPGQLRDEPDALGSRGTERPPRTPHLPVSTIAALTEPESGPHVEWTGMPQVEVQSFGCRLRVMQSSDSTMSEIRCARTPETSRGLTGA